MSEWEVEAELPRLELPAPQCGHCGCDVGMEDGVAWCEGCHVEWSRIEDGGISTPDTEREGSYVPCEIVPEPSRRGIVYGPCILPSGHENEHLTPFSRSEVRGTDTTNERGEKP